MNGSSARARTVPPLQVGITHADITPPVGIAHTNWGAQLHTRAEGIDFPLRATALAAQDSVTGTAAILVDLDLLLLPLPLATAMREAISRLTGVPLAHVRVSATHTHSGPTITSTWVSEGSELIESYVGSLPAKVAGAAWQALRTARPARVAAGTGSCALAVNRRVHAPDGRVVVGRNPDGFVDRTVRVLRFDDAAQRPLAAVVHYACHPTIMAWENRLITPDYPGQARRTVEHLTGVTCLFLQGAAGDAGPAMGFTASHTGDTSYYRRAGTMLGAEAAHVLLGLDTVPQRVCFQEVLESGAPLGVYRHEPAGEPDGTVKVATTRVALPVRQFPSAAAAAASAAAAREELARCQQRGATDAELRDATMRAKRAAQQAAHAALVDGRSAVEIELQAIRIGPAALLGSPAEVFGALGAEIVAASPFEWTAVSGYTNGSTGYLPTAVAFDAGGYEVEMASPFARDAGARFTAAATALLHQLAQGPGG